MDERIIDMPGSADEGKFAMRSVAAAAHAGSALDGAAASHESAAPDSAPAAPTTPPSTDHAATSHAGQPTHHHHSHAAHSVHAGGHHLLQLDDVSVGFERYAGRGVLAPRETRFVVEHLSLSLHEGEILALVGASGSGKTLIADTIMGLFAANAQVTGRVWFDGDAMDERSLTPLRGNRIAFVPQSVESLDPLQRVGRQIERLAQGMTKQEARARRRELFARYRLDEETARCYPFELSGGMARRVLLIGALMNRPRVIVADEPTPGLDMELAVRAMDDFRAFANDGGGVLLITHDIELALRVADRIAVFQNGTVVEETAVASFASPDLLQHPFSRKLWHALPEHGMRCEGHTSDPGELNDPARLRSLSSIVRSAVPDRSASLQKKKDPQPPSPLASCENESVETRSLQAKGICFGYGGKQVLRDFNLTIEPGERVALRAPSGTGKTTLCRILAGYLQPASGTVLADGMSLPRRGASLVQLIAQHPERMMDPAIPIRRSLAEATTDPADAAALASWERGGRIALSAKNCKSSADMRKTRPENCAFPPMICTESPRPDEKRQQPALDGTPGVPEDGEFLPRLLDALGIQRAWLERFPSELSGGELQRCCIARALIARPRYLICDEISTMLDAATQAYLWRFLIDHAQANGIGMVLVTHSDALLDHIATRVVELPAARPVRQTSYNRLQMR